MKEYAKLQNSESVTHKFMNLLVSGFWATSASGCVSFEKDGVVANTETGGAVSARVAQCAVAASDHRTGTGTTRGIRREFGSDSSAGFASLAAFSAPSSSVERKAREAVTVGRLARTAANRFGIFQIDERAGQSSTAATLFPGNLAGQDRTVGRYHVTFQTDRTLSRLFVDRFVR